MEPEGQVSTEKVSAKKALAFWMKAHTNDAIVLGVESPMADTVARALRALAAVEEVGAAGLRHAASMVELADHHLSGFDGCDLTGTDLFLRTLATLQEDKP
jgi:hypothetical protein